MSSRSSVAMNTAKARKLGGVEASWSQNLLVAEEYLHENNLPKMAKAYSRTSRLKDDTAYSHTMYTSKGKAQVWDGMEIMERGILHIGHGVKIVAEVERGIRIEFRTGTRANIIKLPSDRWMVGERVVENIGDVLNIIRRSIEAGV